MFHIFKEHPTNVPSLVCFDGFLSLSLGWMKDQQHDWDWLCSLWRQLITIPSYRQQITKVILGVRMCLKQFSNFTFQRLTWAVSECLDAEDTVYEPLTVIAFDGVVVNVSKWLWLCRCGTMSLSPPLFCPCLVCNIFAHYYNPPFLILSFSPPLLFWLDPVFIWSPASWLFNVQFI